MNTVNKLIEIVFWNLKLILRHSNSPRARLDSMLLHNKARLNDRVETLTKEPQNIFKIHYGMVFENVKNAIIFVKNREDMVSYLISF